MIATNFPARAPGRPLPRLALPPVAGTSPDAVMLTEMQGRDTGPGQFRSGSAAGDRLEASSRPTCKR